MPEHNQAIAFDTFVENATRAADHTITETTLGAFDVWAWMDEKDGTMLTEERVTENGDRWTYTNVQYWTPDHLFHFVAVAPIEPNNWTYDYANDTIAFTNVDGTEDLLLDYVTVNTENADYNTTYGDVNLQFAHLLSKVKCTFVNGYRTENVNVIVENVKITTANQAVYTIVNDERGEWSVATGEVTLELGNVARTEDTESNATENARFTIPNTEATYVVEFDVTVLNGEQKAIDALHKTTTITNVVLEQGKSYNFVAEISPETLNLQAIEFNVVGVDVWDESPANSLEASLRLAAEFGGKFTLTDDIVLDQPLVVSGANTRASHPAVNLEIDLNGKSISYTSDVAAHSAMITVESGNTLVIKDTVGGGKISYNYTGAGDPTFGWGTYTISNNGGTLVIENGTIEMLSDIAFAKHMDCAVFQYSGSTTINGGMISTPNYRSARLWKGDMTINGGEFDGQLWVQAVDNSAVLTINGGSFAPCGGDFSSVFVENSTYTVNLNVTGGTFATKIGCSNYEKDGVRGSVTGGVFGEINSNLVAEGYYTSKLNDKFYVADAYLVTDAASLQTALDENKANIRFVADIVGDVTNTQKPGVVIAVDGDGYNYAGVFTVDGKSAAYADAGLTLKNITFNAASISADACVRLGVGDNNTRYTANVTLDNCTFDVPGAVGVKSYTGGDKNLTITNCVTTANVHSLVQIAGIDGVRIEDCEIYSVRGMNFNSSNNVVVNNCVVNVKKYAARFGANGTDSAAEVYSIKNSSLKSACEEGDAVIILRGNASHSTLTIENTPIEGPISLANDAVDAKVIVDGKEVTAIASSAAELTNVVKDAQAGDTVVVAEGTYGKFPAVGNKELTLICNDVVFEGNSKLNIGGSTVVGATFSNPSGSAVDQTINGVFQDCTFTGSNALRYTYAGETVVFENCVFDGRTYGIHFDGGANDVVFRNCTISGFNGLGAELTMVTFENCTFVGNGKSGYNGANLWGSAKLISCEFTFNGTTTNEWIDCIGANKTYEFKDCTINGVSYTPENYTEFDQIFSRNNTVVKINGKDCQM